MNFLLVFGPSPRLFTKKFCRRYSGRDIGFELKLRRAKTPNALQILCRQEGADFTEKHWKIVAISLAALSEKGLRSEILSAEKQINASLLGSMNAQEFSLATISHIAWTYGKLGIKNPELIGAFKKEVKLKDSSQGKLDDFTKLSWSFALFQEWDQSTFKKIAEGVETKIKEGKMLREDEFFRLQPISLKGRIKWKQEILGTETAARVHEYMQKRRNVIPNGSKFQEEVSRCVIQVCPQEWEWEEEYFLEGYHIDLACPSQKLAIEIDGPQHFYPGTREWLARDHLMDHIFSDLRWKVVRIAYWQWEEAKTPEEKKELITHALVMRQEKLHE